MIEFVLFYLASLGSVPVLMVSLAALARARKRRRTRRVLVGTPRLLADGREGTVTRLTGIVRALDPPIEAPLSRLPCVAYRSRATELRQAIGTPFPVGQPLSYQTVHIQPFALVRPNERDVIVSASYAEFDLPYVALQLDRAAQQEFFRTHKVIASGGAGRFDEVVVADGDTVTIAGTLVGEVDTESHDERGFREGPPRRLHLVGDGPHPLVIGGPNA